MTKEEQWLTKYKDKVFISPSYGKGWWISGKRKGKELGYVRFGYRVVAFNNGIVRFHRIIWTLKNNAIPITQEIHHKDEDKLNNRIDNLVILTKQEHRSLYHSGEKHPMYGRHRRGEASAHHKLMDEDIYRIRMIRKLQGWTYKKIAKEYQITVGQAWNVANKKQWSHL